MMLLPNTLSADDYYQLRALSKPVTVCLFSNPQWISLKYLPRLPFDSYKLPSATLSLAKTSIALSTAWRSNLFNLFSSWLLQLSFNSPSSHMEGTVRSQSLFIVSICDFVSLHHILRVPVFQVEKSLPTQPFLVWKLPLLLLLLFFSQLLAVEVKPLLCEGNRTVHKIWGATEPWIYGIMVSSILFSIHFLLHPKA